MKTSYLFFEKTKQEQIRSKLHLCTPIFLYSSNWAFAYAYGTDKNFQEFIECFSPSDQFFHVIDESKPKYTKSNRSNLPKMIGVETINEDVRLKMNAWLSSMGVSEIQEGANLITSIKSALDELDSL